MATFFWGYSHYDWDRHMWDGKMQNLTRKSCTGLVKVYNQLADNSAQRVPKLSSLRSFSGPVLLASSACHSYACIIDYWITCRSKNTDGCFTVSPSLWSACFYRILVPLYLLVCKSIPGAIDGYVVNSELLTYS
jgi:hypothetical protein